jgi:hypothetical protein
MNPITRIPPRGAERLRWFFAFHNALVNDSLRLRGRLAQLGFDADGIEFQCLEQKIYIHEIVDGAFVEARRCPPGGDAA